MTARILRAGALVAGTLVLGGWSFLDPFHALIERGNREAREKKAAEALGHYDAAAKEAPTSPIPDFNRSLLLAKEGRVDEAKQAFEAAQGTADPAIAADAHYNNGNLLLEQKDTKGAIEQYLRSLDLDPSDPDARRNLEIAMRKLEEEKKQQQQQQQSQDQKQQNEQQKDESKDGSDEKKQEPSDDPNQKPQEPPKNDEQQQPNTPDSSSAPGEQQEPPPPSGESPPMEGRLSREDAARLLNAIQSDELKVLRKLEEKKGQPSEVGDDW